MAIPINEDPYHRGHFLSYKDDDLSQSPPTPSYRPRSIEDIIAKTKFTKREVQMIYRSFKQLCPSGVIQKSTFQDIYAQFFPHGNTKAYSLMVFRTLDRHESGHVTFEEFVTGLSAITRGTVEEKLDWVFSLYDVSGKGEIGQDELHQVTQSMYDMLSRHVHGPASKNDVSIHAQHAFQRLTNNGSLLAISRTDFITACMQDDQLCQSFALFDTKL